PLQVKADDGTKVYGAALPDFTVIYTGFVNGDDESSLTTPASVTTTATQASPVGTYTLTPGGAVDPDYTFTYVPGTLGLTPPPLGVAANPQTFVYGGTLPDLTFITTGLVNGDTVGTVLTGALATTATSTSNVGTYPITQGTLVANSNY